MAVGVDVVVRYCGLLDLGAVAYYIICFFSSRRRHTRFDCDWSSDVCSSDLGSTPGNYTLVFTFANNLVSVSGAGLVTGFGSVSSSGIGPNLNQYTVNLINVTNRSEEHTSELQSQSNLVCRLLLEKKQKIARSRRSRARAGDLVRRRRRRVRSGDLPLALRAAAHASPRPGSGHRRAAARRGRVLLR